MPGLHWESPPPVESKLHLTLFSMEYHFKTLIPKLSKSIENGRNCKH